MVETRFFRAAALAFAAGLVVQTTEISAKLGDTPEVAWAPDAVHLMIGAIGLVILGLLVRSDPRLAPDPWFRKGAAPRAYYTFVLGLALRAFVAPFAPRSTFYGALTLAGQLLEVAALAMLLLAKRTEPAKA